MTYKKLYEDALYKLEHNKITLGEFEEMIKPLEREVEQEPTTKENLGVDAISRADSIKAMQNKAKKLKNEDTINGLCGAVAILYEMPSITPIRPKGHWLDTGWISECSCCHERSYPFDDTGYGSIYHNFCPNCGADMREVEE